MRFQSTCPEVILSICGKEYRGIYRFLSNYYVNPQGGNSEPVPEEEMMLRLLEAAEEYRITPGDTSIPKLIVLRADAQVPLQAVVTMWDILNQLNEQFEEADRFKLIFATEAKE